MGETEPDDYRDLFKKVKSPKVDDTPLPPIPLEDVDSLVSACAKTWHGLRDAAMLLCLLDTGARANEFLSLNVDDINLRTGSAFIRIGKGGKPRTVFIGKTARRANKHYLRTRNDGPLWTTQDGDKLSYSGLRSMLRRRSDAIQVDTPPHMILDEPLQ